jgi:hypothetical protein
MASNGIGVAEVRERMEARAREYIDTHMAQKIVSMDLLCRVSGVGGVGDGGSQFSLANARLDHS